MIVNIGLVVAILVFAILAERFMIKNEQGKRENKHIGIAVLFGVLAIGIAFVIESVLGYVSNVHMVGTGQLNIGLVPSLFFFMAIGLIEESAKFFPFAWHIRRKPFFDEVADGLIYFAAVGLTFGVLEDIEYIFAAHSNEGILRLTTDLFFHAGLTGIIGYFFAKAHRLHLPIRKSVSAAFVAAVVLHGAFDFFLNSGNGLFVLCAFGITIFLNCNLFWLYYKAVKLDMQLQAMTTTTVTAATVAPAVSSSREADDMQL